MSEHNCGTNTDGHTHHHSAAMPASGENLLGRLSGDVAECPVMKGSTVVKAEAEAAGLFRDFDGTRYWLCCAGCGPLFDANPAQYAAA